MQRWRPQTHDRGTGSWFAILAILLLAFALRAGYSTIGLRIRMAIDPRPVGDDGYQDLARAFLQTGGYPNEMRPPLYPARGGLLAD